MVTQPSPPLVPDHELIRRIGGGSYGEVWLAKNAIGTLRAVKIVQRQTFEREEHFEREFKNGAALARGQPGRSGRESQGAVSRSKGLRRRTPG